ncbi:EamA family transporter RarD [Pseudophaeobacter sp. EL27]|uniref:EamA family transporter RarD n=1 Tax=Pseudophaeobacter sp. EL27 TaxID=2107580 RepID=UPI000EFBB7EC|nr:EamA family transporter RarD [Pseudophaeobacter sp. EL27]
MTEGTKGVIAMIVTCTIWGLSGIFYKLLAHIPPEQVLSHRILWSGVFFACILAVQGRVDQLVAALTQWRRVRVLMLATAMISLNWFIFITSVQIERATESSLGYYIFPLVSVVLGRVFFGEHLSRAQGLAIGLATFAVALLTYGLGVAPWIALVLGFSFAIYGVVKKGLDIGPVVSVTAEVWLLFPIAILVILLTGGGGIQGSWRDAGLLMLSGPLTGAPLILFSYAARRVALGSIGVLQYINPTLQALVATVVFGELFTPWHGAAFGLIWGAVIIFSLSALQKSHQETRDAQAVKTPERS